jgi:transposase
MALLCVATAARGGPIACGGGRAGRPDEGSPSEAEERHARCRPAVRTPAAGIYQAVVHVPLEEIEQLRSTLSHRRHFVRLATARINAAKKMLRGAGLFEPSRQHLGSLRAWRLLLEALAAHPQVRSLVELHQRAFQAALEQTAACEKLLEERHALFRLEMEKLKTVPGVGDIVALTALAAFSDATRFRSATHAASHARLVPRTWQSVETNRQGHNTKTGSAGLRAGLVRAAHTARRPSSP